MATLAAERHCYAQALVHDVDSPVQQLRTMPEVQMVLLFGSYVVYTHIHPWFIDTSLGNQRES